MTQEKEGFPAIGGGELRGEKAPPLLKKISPLFSSLFLSWFLGQETYHLNAFQIISGQVISIKAFPYPSLFKRDPHLRGPPPSPKRPEQVPSDNLPLNGACWVNLSTRPFHGLSVCILPHFWGTHWTPLSGGPADCVNPAVGSQAFIEKPLSRRLG